MKTILHTKALSIGYLPRILVENLDFQLETGKLCAIIGRNGTGKTSLLRILCGLAKPIGGQVFLKDKLIQDYNTAQLAKELALVNTERIRLQYFKVEELVALGRYPYTGFLGRLTSKDKEAVNQAITATDIANLRHKKIAELSDGEHQKVMIARALAQETPLLFLDEPTAHLDVVNRVEVFRLLKKISQEQGKTILLSTHELDVALQVADQVLLLDNSTQAWTGTPKALKTAGRLEQAFQGLSIEPNTGRIII